MSVPYSTYRAPDCSKPGRLRDQTGRFLFLPFASNSPKPPRVNLSPFLRMDTTPAAASWLSPHGFMVGSLVIILPALCNRRRMRRNNFIMPPPPRSGWTRSQETRDKPIGHRMWTCMYTTTVRGPSHASGAVQSPVPISSRPSSSATICTAA